VPLVLSPETGSITPQFHVVFDDWFATVASEDGALPDFNSPEWSRLFSESTYQFSFDESEVDSSVDPIDSVSRAAEAHRESVARAMDVAPPSVLLPVAPLIDLLVSIPREPPVSSPREPPVLSPREPEPTVASLPSVEVRPTASDPVEIQATPPTTPAAPLAPPAAVPSSVVRRSSRVSTAPSRLGYDGKQGHRYLAFDPHAMMIYLANDIPAPSAFKVNADPDTLTYDEAIADPDRDCWLESMLVEITSLESKEAWDEVFTDEARTRILPGTWVFRRKRNPNGMITKFKAWYCVRGDLQEDDSPTYAPVVAWSSV